MFSTTFNDEAKLWSGRNIPPLYNERISVADVLFNAMTKYGSKIAQVIIKKIPNFPYLPVVNSCNNFVKTNFN